MYLRCSGCVTLVQWACALEPMSIRNSSPCGRHEVNLYPRLRKFPAVRLAAIVLTRPTSAVVTVHLAARRQASWFACCTREARQQSQASWNCHADLPTCQRVLTVYTSTGYWLVISQRDSRELCCKKSRQEMRMQEEKLKEMRIYKAEGGENNMQGQGRCHRRERTDRLYCHPF